MKPDKEDREKGDYMKGKGSRNLRAWEGEKRGLLGTGEEGRLRRRGGRGEWGTGG